MLDDGVIKDGLAKVGGDAGEGGEAESRLHVHILGEVILRVLHVDIARRLLPGSGEAAEFAHVTAVGLVAEGKSREARKLWEERGQRVVRNEGSEPLGDGVGVVSACGEANATANVK